MNSTSNGKISPPSPLVSRPDVVYPPGDLTYRQSWSRADKYLSSEHEKIWETTKELPGWQDLPDSEKLYEMAYYSGEVILEIGVFGGRSAVVELRGALAAVRDRGAREPQFYGVDVDPGAIPRSRETIEKSGVADYAILYQGTLAHFRKDIPIVPTMVFVDGDHRYEGCLADLKILAGFLAPGTPVFCHDYEGIEGVRRAVDEAVATLGAYEFAGQFSGSALLRTTAKCYGVPRGLAPGTFVRLRDSLKSQYERLFIDPLPESGFMNVWRHTMGAREELLQRFPRRFAGDGRALPGSSGQGAYGAWPYSSRECPAMPATLPGGIPWPRISIVTPTYNQGHYIEQTILSVLNQNYPNLQYIVVDGASTDETMEVVGRYRNEMHTVISEKDKGQSSAINKGMKLADGELVTWLNSDDMLTPGALHAMALAFHTSGADIVTGMTLLQKNGETTGRHLTSCANGPLPLNDLLDLENCWTQGQFWYQPETMFTRALWEKAGGHVKEDLYYSMDYELWLRFAEQKANLKVVGRPIALYRVHENQKTYNQAEFRPELEKVRGEFVVRVSASPVGGEGGGEGAGLQAGVDRTNSADAAPHPSPLPQGERGPMPARAKANRSKLKLLFFNDLGSVAGAGIAHHRLASAAAVAGHEVVAIAVKPSLTKTARTVDNIVKEIAAHRPDMVFVGNLHSAHVDPNLPGQLAKKFPTVQILHDLWPLTGRCAYPGDCMGYAGGGTGCDEKCPTRNEYPVIAPAAIRVAWEDKYRALTSETPQVLAGVSQYTETFAKNRFIGVPTAPPIISFRYGLDTAIFKPRDRATCREMLNLPQDKFIILFSATHLSEKRKGLQYLLDALNRLHLPDLLCVSIGNFDPAKATPTNTSDISDLKSQIQFRSMGYINDPYSLATLYSAADLFVGPSQIETFGQVYIEAAACGTPSVAFRVGGVPEALIDGVTGLLANSIDSESLGALIEFLHQSPSYRNDLSRWGRLWVENEFSLASAAHRMFSELRKIGIAGQLQLMPNLTISPTSTPNPLMYLDAQDAIVAPTAATSSNASFGQLQMKLAALEAERDALRRSLNDVTSTFLWRSVSKLYPLYARTISNPKLPGPVRNGLASVGRMLAKKK